jgi:hypothetical protein
MAATRRDIAMAERHLPIDLGALLQGSNTARQREEEGSDGGGEAERRDGGG